MLEGDHNNLKAEYELLHTEKKDGDSDFTSSSDKEFKPEGDAAASIPERPISHVLTRSQRSEFSIVDPSIETAPEVT